MVGHMGRTWTEDDLVREMRASTIVIRDGLVSLSRAGLLQSDDGGVFRYAPGSPRLEALAEALANAYRERPLTVTRMVFEDADDRLRGFADAFRIKKD